MRPTALSPEQLLLDQHDLTARQLEQVLGTALARRTDYADLYFETRTAEAVSLEEGLVKKTARSLSQGVGVRVLADDKTGYAHSDDISIEALQLAAQTAQTIAHTSNSGTTVS